MTRRPGQRMVRPTSVAGRTILALAVGLLVAIAVAGALPTGSAPPTQVVCPAFGTEYSECLARLPASDAAFQAAAASWVDLTAPVLGGAAGALVGGAMWLLLRPRRPAVAHPADDRWSPGAGSSG